MRGYIDRLFEDEGYGFIDAADGSDLSFNLDKIPHHKLDKIKIGSKVQFTMSENEQGLYAHSVTPI